MPRTIRYITHPQVEIDPDVEVQKWSLNGEGRRRINALARSNVLRGTADIFSSAETKAIETARPIADALGCSLTIREKMHENDRSATGFLPPETFEAVADQFFLEPDESVRGWEAARRAQARIVSEVHKCLETSNRGDVLFVGHGAVGTLLFCHLSGLPISRVFDQIAGGGCYFEFPSSDYRPTTGWRTIEDLIALSECE